VNEKRGGPLKPPHPTAVAAPQTPTSVSLTQLERRLRIARWAHEQMPLTVVYGPRRLRPVGLERYLAEGRWVA
jgi:hypothetical protein